jgi:3-deoxy-7-phosphoheptulonate synthase
MILVLERGITKEDKDALIESLKQEDLMIKEIQGVEETILGVVGKIPREIRYYESMPGVSKAMPISQPFKLVSREIQSKSSIIKVHDVEIGGDRLVIIAGPCGVEERERTLAIARAVRRSGAVLFRGGAFKPRTSPYSFQGLGEEGLKILAQVREETGMGVVTEMTTPNQADLMVKYVDVVQVGTRNMQNFELLKTVGRMGKPVLLKRGLSATIKDWLMAAEYIASEGNDQIILCERGIRTFETHTRNTLDLTAVPVIKKLSHLPIIIDPSHATGIREMVAPMARAAVAAGADGITMEVHTDPDKALSDGPQSLYPHQFEQLMRDLYVIAPVVGKQLDFSYLEKAEALRPRSGQAKPSTKVLYHGAPGTISHKACKQFFGSNGFESRGSYAEVVREVDGGTAGLGMLPLENSISGSLHENYDLLMEHQVRIVGEVNLKVVNNLIGWEGAKLSQVKRVYAHSQVFEQCKAFLDQHPEWDLIASENTVSNVERVKDSEDHSAAAISSQEAAELYGMTVIKEGIDSNPRNFTRFAVISKGEFPAEPANKTSLIFTVSDKPGSLFAVLSIFADREVNIVKLESRPLRDRPWEYQFYLDFELEEGDKRLDEILSAVQEAASTCRCLGSYPKGPAIKS